MSLGWVDANAVSWYRAHKENWGGVNREAAKRHRTDAIQSFTSLIKDTFEEEGSGERFDQVVMIAAPPPILLSSFKNFVLNVVGVDYELRFFAVEDMSRAIKEVCEGGNSGGGLKLKEKGCRFVDVNEQLMEQHVMEGGEIAQERVVKKNFKQLLYYDPHILPFRSYGLLIDEMLRVVEGMAFRCVEEVGGIGVVEEEGVGYIT